MRLRAAAAALLRRVQNCEVKSRHQKAERKTRCFRVLLENRADQEAKSFQAVAQSLDVVHRRVNTADAIFLSFARLCSVDPDRIPKSTRALSSARGRILTHRSIVDKQPLKVRVACRA